MASYPIGEAKSQLSRLVARAEAGEDIVIRRGSQPAVRLVPVDGGDASAGPRSVVGLLAGRIELAPDFDDELPEFFGEVEPEPA